MTSAQCKGISLKVLKSCPNINDLSKEALQLFMREEFSKKSQFQQIFKKDLLNCEIRETASKLQNEIKNHLKKMGIHPKVLEDLHDCIEDDLKEYNFNDGVNKISQSFYEMDESFYNIYHQLLKNIRKKFLDFDFYFQKTPTLRLHTPNSLNNHHYPRYHSDIVYGHPPQEINLWIPLTNLSVQEKHGFKITDVKNTYNILDRYDFNFEKFIDHAINNPQLTDLCHSVSKDVETKFGEMLVFDSRCLHTGMPLTHQSRISMDIRIIPTSAFSSLDYKFQGTGRRKVIFAPGSNYHSNSIEKIS